MNSKRQKRNISGWLILDKPLEMTSTQAVGKVRWLFEAAKAGHAGTLDPLATGILPIALGEATKTVPYVQDGVKTYRFAVAWGTATSTDDAEGEVVATSPVRPTEAAVRAALPLFIGTVRQVPPAFSALKVAGERAYDLARAGETVQLAEREIRVDTLTLVAHGETASQFEVVCGKGTYVRALARDLALALGTCGHVSALRRTQVGGFDEARAVSVEALEAATAEDRDRLLLPVSAGLAALPEFRVSAAEAALIRNGNPLLLTGINAPVALEAAWVSLRGQAVAVGEVAGGHFRPRRVIVA